MNNRDETGRDDGDRTIGEEVADQATTLKEGFNLSPETARVTAEDKVASRMRNPASDDVEQQRIAAAQAQAPGLIGNGAEKLGDSGAALDDETR